jgi:hypothetical protein
MSEVKKPHRRRWDDKVKIDLTENGLKVWIGFMWLGIRTMAGSCEHG